jgi:hypothetical protein
MYRAFRLTVAILFASAVLADDSTTSRASQLVFQKQVLKFIADTIDWYRHLPTAQRIGMEPGELLFRESNRPIAAEIVRLSFEFGKDIAANDRRQNSEDHSESAAYHDLHDLIAEKARLDANTKEAVDQLKSVTEEKLNARHDDWKKFDAQMAEIRSRIELLKAMATNYEELLGFVRTATAEPDGVTNMATLVENLERTVPGASVAVPPLQTSGFPAEASHPPYGIMGMISRASMVARREQIIDGVIEQTDTLTNSLQNVRTPLTEPFRKQLLTFSLDTESLDVLQGQQSRLTDLLTEVRTASLPIAALSKQQMLLNLYRSHLAERRSEIQKDDLANRKALVRRLVLLVIAITGVLGTGVVVRRLSYRYVREGHRRQMLLLSNQVLSWLITLAVVFYAFAFDLSSLATFLGLLSAGLAVGLHDVFLAIGGYLLIVRKLHIRMGDQVHISGVTGEVRNLGLLQFELSEIDPATGQRTGRVASFSTSYVFVSPATPLFRQFSAPACGLVKPDRSRSGELLPASLRQVTLASAETNSAPAKAKSAHARN